MSDGDDARLAPPAVDPAAYDESYYRTWCGGFAEWVATEGAGVAGIYPGSLARAGLAPGEVLVDLGTGRGELLVCALAAGASRVVGVDYSPAAVNLARHTLDAHGAADRAEVLLADGRRVPVADGEADLVTLLDVVEHLTPEELTAVLGEAHRILRPGGRVFIHTFPTRTVYDVTYRWQRRLRPRRRRSWPADPRQEIERRLHVNEQTRRSLRTALRRAGFRPVRVATGEWVFDEFVPDPAARPLYGRLAAFRPTRHLGAADLWATAWRPPDGG